jgi:hypothetical protein
MKRVSECGAPKRGKRCLGRSRSAFKNAGCHLPGKSSNSSAPSSDSWYSAGSACGEQSRPAASPASVQAYGAALVRSRGGPPTAEHEYPDLPR